MLRDLDANNQTCAGTDARAMLCQVVGIEHRGYLIIESFLGLFKERTM